jgi:hypothetical protein
MCALGCRVFTLPEYAAICKENGITRETVEQYAPEVLEKVFPAMG